MVEHDLAKVGVAGSSPVSRSFYTQKGVLKKDPLLCIKRAHGARRFEVSAAASVDYTVRSISTPFSSIAFKSSSNASSSVIRTSKALIGQMLIIESVPILLVG